jgi:hypothetical protein
LTSPGTTFHYGSSRQSGSTHVSLLAGEPPNERAAGGRPKAAEPTLRLADLSAASRRSILIKKSSPSSPARPAFPATRQLTVVLDTSMSHIQSGRHGVPRTATRRGLLTVECAGDGCGSRLKAGESGMRGVAQAARGRSFGARPTDPGGSADGPRLDDTARDGHAGGPAVLRSVQRKRARSWVLRAR